MRLTFPNGEHAAVNLEHGQVGVGSAAGGGTTVAIAGLSPLHAVFATGRRGSWLTVPQDAVVVVNARPVRRIAFLRAGDLVCLAGVQVRVESDQPPPAIPDAQARRRPSDDAASFGVAKASLRGLSGAWFGRSLPLVSTRVLGRGAGSDARIEGPGLQERHVQIDVEDGVVVLRTLSPAALVRVNGHAVRGAVLAQGDQIELGDQRFVLEAPGLGQGGEAGDTPVPTRRDTSTPTSMPSINVPHPAPATPAAKRDLSGLYLLVAAAAALAAALTAFFVYAPKG